MIDFPCHCGHKFSVDPDMAGGMLQCPKCGRLNDVPLLSDLPHIADDGTYTLELLPERDSDAQASELTRIYRKGTVDENGAEIDLRPTLENIHESGTEEIPLELADQLRPGVPKYDPITGELIMPVDVEAPIKPAPPPPVAARPALSSGEFFLGARPLQILLDLFRPVNLFVMFFIFLGHALIGFMTLVLAVGGLLFIVLVPAMIAAVVAHYGNVVDETGPSGRDELPTPLRSLQWHDDLWGPFRDIMLAALVCYGPAIALTVFPPPEKNIAAALTLALAIAGTIAMPAALLTTLTSGSILNVRPDRLLGVMVKCGFHYVVLVIVWIAAIGLYAMGMLASLALILWLFNARLRSWLPPAALAAPIVVAGIYLMHYFCWYLGLMYRAHHDEFPWVLQSYQGKRRGSTGGFAVIPAKHSHGKSA